MSKLVAKLNYYFFEYEEISAHDAGWFYGLLGGAVVLTALIYVKTL